MTLIKSISGIRGLIDESLNPSMIARYAQAFSLISPNDGIILLARDTRNSGKEYIQIAISALERISRKSIVVDIVPTPTAQFEVFSKGYAGGIVFTASHNPSDWNGIKFIGPEGTFINQEAFNRLEHEFKNLSNTLNQKLKKIEHIIFKKSGEEFNIASPKQLGVILFEKLNDTVLSDISSKLYSIYFKNVGKLLISQPELINSSFNFLASKTESLLSP